MRVEQEVKGWKMILNTTEFLCVQDKNQFWNSLHELGGRMYWLEGLIMVDDPNYNYPDLNLWNTFNEAAISRLFTRRMAVMEER